MAAASQHFPAGPAARKAGPAAAAQIQADHTSKRAPRHALFAARRRKKAELPKQPRFLIAQRFA